MALAVTEPGVFQVSRDGGRSFAPVRPPAGVALAVWNAEDRTLVRTTAGTYRWTGESLADEPAGPSPQAWLRPPAEAAADFARALDPRPLALDPRRAAPCGAGRIAMVRGGALEIVDARTGATLSREGLPGEDCTLQPGFPGVRAVCRHGAWATMVAARDEVRPGWTVLRDELRAEPAGTTLFDDVTPAWFVHAPCQQRTVPDAREACVYDRLGAPHGVRLPSPAEPVAMHNDVALALATTGTEVTAAFLVRPSGATPLRLPDGVQAPVAAAWTAHGLALVHGTPEGTRALSLSPGSSVLSPSPTWHRTVFPDGYDHGVFGPDGTLWLWGADARFLARVPRGGGLTPLASPVLGNGRALPLDPAAGGWCVAPWCTLGGTLALGPRGGRAATVIARAVAPPEAPDRPLAPRGLRCTHDAVSVAPEIDRGVAVSGHAMQWFLQGTRLTVTWSGETLQGTVTGTVPSRADAVVLGRGVQGARVPAGLIERCGHTGCEHFLALRTGITELGLGRRVSGGVEVQQRTAGGWVVRADDSRDGVAVVTLVALDARGTETARKTYALAGSTDDASVGCWEGRDGLWVRDRGRSMRFMALDPADLGGETLATVPVADARTGPCAVGTVTRGEARLVAGVTQVRGPGWYVEAGEWQTEEVLAVDTGATCVRSITGGEARDEREERANGRVETEPVRSFVLGVPNASEGESGLTGRAWSGRRAITLRCAWDDSAERGGR